MIATPTDKLNAHMNHELLDSDNPFLNLYLFNG